MNKLKTFFSFIFLTFVSLFLLPSFVNASEFTFSIPNNYDLKSYVENILPTAINTIDTYFTNNPSNFNSSTRYWLYYNHTNGQLFAYTYPNAGLPAYVSIVYGNYVLRYNSPSFKLEFSSDYTSIVNRTSDSTNYVTLGPVSVFYANFPVKFYYTNYPGNTLTITYTDKSYSTIDDADHTFPTVYELYDIWFSIPPTPTPTPTPVDNYPRLTGYYSTFIDRLSYLCDYIVSDYIFLSIFSIIILYIVFLLFRRLR